mgnify:CR=1 FL=1
MVKISKKFNETLSKEAKIVYNCIDKQKFLPEEIKNTGLSSEEFCQKLLASQKVAVVPGNAFGESGEGYVRASYCYSVEHIKEALVRIERFLKEI